MKNCFSVQSQGNPMICIFEAFNLERQYMKGNLQILPHQIAKLNLLMGILFTLSIAFTDQSVFSTNQKP
jgi:hypothetical protein